LEIVLILDKRIILLQVKIVRQISCHFFILDIIL